MVFSSILFLWVLLPVVLAAYYLPQFCGKAGSCLKFQNFILVVFSLFFYAWGEPRYILLMLLSVLINYSFGLLIERKQQKLLMLVICVAANLLILGYFKYFNFFVEIWNGLAGSTVQLSVRTAALPIGISFYTFQALSYVVDVYRKENRAQKNFLHMMLYISFFPQLIAGPIVKYHDIEQQIENRKTTLSGFSYGIKRFRVFCSGVQPSFTCCRFILIFPVTQTWRLDWAGCSAFRSRKIFCCLIRRFLFGISGGNGMFLFPAGSVSMSIFRLAETARGRRVHISI